MFERKFAFKSNEHDHFRTTEHPKIDQCVGSWTDPEFDPAIAALYYVRVLEIPTPRWTTIDAVKNNLPLLDSVPSTVQERAWSSPIWTNPASVQTVATANN